ncbi:dihydrodipicolinate synthase family protein [Eubacterium limosum]|uniref:Dihydrodipicolinate synthase family protein n=1 Tax=Eubacterium limosum TaxID=1736 RepID=A0ABT5UUP3_EUBLI|nr:dihydrodipicolinate synthase family protein [Eubacterium limosum]MCB6570405.1 dihydrodipicolinate synthase family protein [Eubacterium limosum]MDE1472388.1 dihydrodipicolinate synthase family protein [Eubacterium limosum]
MYKKNDMVRRHDHELIRNHVAIFDFTMGLVEITGKDARAFLDEMCVNDLAHLVPGKVMYTSILNEEAVMIDDVTFYCYSDEKFWMISPFKDNTLNWFEKHKNKRTVRFEDLSDEISLWSVQGPDSRRMLASYLKNDMTDMKYYTFMENEAGGIPILLSRTGFTGELGFEIFADSARISQIVTDLLRIGKKYGVRIVESDVTLESVPTEKGLITVRDFGGANPLEMGMEWSVNWDKPHFTGKEKLLKIKENGPARRLMGFVASDDTIDIENESPVWVKEKVIGKVTTANYGYTVEESIGYCLIEAGHAQNGGKAVVKTGGQNVEITLCDRVFYDPQRLRINAKMDMGNLKHQNSRAYLEGKELPAAKEFKGVYAAIATPMNRDESLNTASVRNLVEHLVLEGLDGILVGGSSGEYPAMSIEERKQLFKAAVEAADGRFKIAACCSTNTTAGTKELCSYAGEIGVDFNLIMTPFDPPTTEEAMVDYYKEIARFSKPGVIIYHYPDYTGVTLSVESIAELSKEKNICGIKNVADLTSTVAIINETRNQAFGVLTGTDETFLGTLACGGHGFMGVGACAAPKLCRRLYDSFMAGDLEKAQGYHRMLCKVMSVIFGHPFPSSLKAAVEMQGIDCGFPRKPAATIDTDGKRQLYSVLVEAGVI